MINLLFTKKKVFLENLMLRRMMPCLLLGQMGICKPHHVLFQITGYNCLNHGDICGISCCIALHCIA